MDYGRKEWGSKECKFNHQKRIICGIEECQFEFILYYSIYI